MKKRKFLAHATAYSYLSQEFELTEDEYQAAIKEHGCIEQYAAECVDPGGFRELPNGGDWDSGDVYEINEESTND